MLRVAGVEVALHHILYGDLFILLSFFGIYWRLTRLLFPLKTTSLGLSLVFFKTLTMNKSCSTDGFRAANDGRISTAVI